MSAHLSCAVSELNNPTTAADLIDHAIRECYLQSRPVYITLPTDMVKKQVEGARLDTPLDLEFAENDKEKEDYCVQDALRYLNEAKNPVIVVDACAIRHHVCFSCLCQTFLLRNTKVFERHWTKYTSWSRPPDCQPS